MSEPRTSDRNVDRVIRSWLHEDRHEDVSRVAGAVLDLLDTTPQRRSPWWPARRIPFMKKFVSLGLGAAAVVAALVIGAQVLGPPAPGDFGGAPSASPSLTPAPSATLQPSPSPMAAPPLTQSFTSQLHGISLSYPEGWTAQAATGPWTDGPNSHPYTDPQADRLYDPTLPLGTFLTIASQPIGDSTPEDWIVEQMAEWEQCTATEPIALGEASGLIGSEGCDLAVVTIDGRGYWISLRTSDDDPSAAPFDRAWFEEVLATVQLHPEDAVD
jgi:hypothetical protein